MYTNTTESEISALIDGRCVFRVIIFNGSNDS